MNEARIKVFFTSKERLYDQNIGEKLNEDDGERKKNWEARRISVSKTFHLQFTHTNEAQLEKLKGFVDRLDLHLSLIALNVGFDIEFHFFGSRDRGQESDQNRALLAIRPRTVRFALAAMIAASGA